MKVKTSPREAINTLELYHQSVVSLINICNAMLLHGEIGEHIKHEFEKSVNEVKEFYEI